MMVDELSTVGHVTAYFLPKGLSVQLYPCSAKRYRTLPEHASPRWRRRGFSPRLLCPRCCRARDWRSFCSAASTAAPLVARILVLPLDGIQRAPTLGDVPHFSAMETDFIGSF